MRILDRKINRATVVGYARTGRAVTAFLLSHGVEPVVTDSNRISPADKHYLDRNSVPYEDGGHTERALAGADLVVVSPGVPENVPLLAQARAQKIPIVSELDLASQFLGDIPIIAVTGTNGKSTTVKLIEAILRAQGMAAVSAGNIGTPLIAMTEDKYDALVVEVSSFQLAQSRLFHPHVGVLLNITPDHLDRHGTLSDYRAAKLRLFMNQTPDDWAVIPHGLAIPGLRANHVFYDRIPIPVGSAFAHLFPHNRANLQAAIAAARCIIPIDANEIPYSALADAFSLPFRMQIEGEINGATVINDSKSTNAASTIAALRSVAAPVVLLLGGRHKGAGYDALANEIAVRRVRHTVVYGEAGSFLTTRLRAVGISEITQIPDFSGAVECAVNYIKSGDVLLFSPACSSYDQFKNYRERGTAFSSLIRQHQGYRPPATN